MQALSLKLKGLYTYPNNLGNAIPEGALEKAANMVIDAEGIAEVRRGFSRLGGPFSETTDQAQKYFVYQDKLLASYTGNQMGWYRDTSVSGTYTTSDNVVVASNANTAVGDYVYGTGIPANTKIESSNTTHIILDSKPTIAGTSETLTVSGWVDYSTLQPPISTTFKIQSAEANQNFYFTTQNGVQKLSAYNDADSVDAGLPRGLDITATPVAETGGFLVADNQVAYRCVWGITDNNDNLILSAPSNQTVATVASGGDDSKVSLAITIPSVITVFHFVQIYRSRLSGGASIAPSEDMQLVYENNPTAAEISTGTMTVVDNLPTSLVGAYLYTSPTEEGIAQANEQPPYSRAITTFKDSVFYGNTNSKHRLSITMAGVGKDTTCSVNIADDDTIIDSLASNDAVAAWVGCLVQEASGNVAIIPANTVVASVTDTDTIVVDTAMTENASSIVVSANVTIAGVTYVPRTAENTSGVNFKVTVSGTPSQDIADTAQSLVRVINGTTAQTNVYAYYISSVDDLPGEILIEERDLGGSSFAATTPAFGTEWSPVLPTSGTAVSSTAERQKNGVFFSKFQEPEAVPLVNNFRIGSAAKEIMRMVPVRDSLFVLKEDGIWRILGQDANDFRVEVVDLSTEIIGPETAQELNNQLFALTNQGVTIITETGVAIVSNPIEGDLLNLFGSSLASMKENSFAIGYKTDRSYMLWLTAGNEDTPEQCYRYNTIHQNWTRWVVGASAGILNDADDKIYIGDNASAYTLPERKNYDYTDYIDEHEQINITAANATSVTVSDASSFRVGDILYQSSTVFSKVTAIDSSSNMLTVETDYTSNAAAYALGSTTIANSDWSTDSASRYAFIPITIEWMPNSGDNPGIMKHFKDISVFVTDTGFKDFDLSFKTELDNTFESVTVNGSNLLLWGLFGWGQETWPGNTTLQGTLRTYTPIAKARGSLLTVKLESDIAYRRFGLQGISIPFLKGNEWTRNK